MVMMVMMILNLTMITTKLMIISLIMTTARKWVRICSLLFLTYHCLTVGVAVDHWI